MQPNSLLDDLLEFCGKGPNKRRGIWIASLYFTPKVLYIESMERMCECEEASVRSCSDLPAIRNAPHGLLGGSQRIALNLGEAFFKFFRIILELFREVEYLKA
jgi:hypothetical protein